MAITQLNTADFDYEMMLNVINKSYKGKADITISEYDTDAAPDVKVGSVFEDNGAIFLVDTADITPSGYGGISNSTIFYLYYDEDPGAFIFSSTAPTWNDALQGWYNSNDRAFFSMFKDSGGTLYQNKVNLNHISELQTKIIDIGAWDMETDTTATITHNIGDKDQIKSIAVIIVGDELNINLSLETVNLTTGTTQGGIGSIGDSTIALVRLTGGTFDSTSYNSTAINRGWVTIQYRG